MSTQPTTDRFIARPSVDDPEDSFNVLDTSRLDESGQPVIRHADLPRKRAQDIAWNLNATPPIALYTDAPQDYDGFSTITIKIIGVSNRPGRKGDPVRLVELEQRDYDWQTMRYGSGMCCYTNQHMKLEDYVRFGDWTLTEEPTR